MNKTTSLIRVILLMALGLIAICLFFSEDQSLTYLVIEKIAAICVAWLIRRLYRKWSKTDPWLIAYEKWCERG